MGTVSIICMVIGAVAAVICGIWVVLEKVFKMGKAAQRMDSIESDVSTIKKTMESLPCSKHLEDITKIKTILVEKYSKMFNVLTMKCSPRRLSEVGQKLYDKVHGEDFIKTNKMALFDYIKQSKPLVALDVEQAANAACMSLTSTPAFNDLKDFVYNEPTWTLKDGSKFDITVGDLCIVIGLKLRDKYLEEVGVK